MRTFFLTLCACLMSLLIFAQKNSRTSNINVLDPSGAKSITIAFSCANIWPEASDADVFIIEMSIHSNMPQNILEALSKVGRYDLEGYKKDDEFIITAPRLSNDITVQGIELEEKINLYIQTPGKYKLEDKTLQKDIIDFTYRGEGASMAAPSPMEKMKRISQKVELRDINIQCEGSNCDEICFQKEDIRINGETIDWKNFSAK